MAERTDSKIPFAARIADEIIENTRRRMDTYDYNLKVIASGMVTDVVEKTVQRLKESNGYRRRYKIEEIIAITKQCLREANLGHTISEIKDISTYHSQKSDVTPDDDVVAAMMIDIKAKLSACNYANVLINSANAALQRADQEAEVRIQRNLQSIMPSEVTSRYDHVIGSIKKSFLAEERIGDNCSAIMMYRSIQSRSDINGAYVTDEDNLAMSKKSLESCKILASMVTGEQPLNDNRVEVMHEQHDSVLLEIKPEQVVSDVKTESVVSKVQKLKAKKTSAFKMLSKHLRGIIGSCVMSCVSSKHSVTENISTD